MNRRLIVLFMVILVAALTLLLVFYEKAKVTSPTLPSQYSSTNPNSMPQKSYFQHIFIILEENNGYSSIIGNPNASYINSLIKQYSLLTNYYATDHPSLPNYLELTSGTNGGITNDCNPAAVCNISVSNLADELESHNLTWKEYAESMPSNCYLYNFGNYATKHNPFVYYKDITTNINRCRSHVVPYSQMQIDLSSTDTTPDFAFITPNLCNDMHNCSINIGDNWLSQNVPIILKSKAFTEENSLLIITWDESDGGNNHVATLLIGPSVKPGSTLSGLYNHYSLLHTVEVNWGLPGLTANDKNANIISGFTN